MSTLRIPRLGVKCLPVFRRPFVSTACSRALLRACSSIRSTEGLPCAVSSSQFLCSPSCLWFPTLQPNRPITVPYLTSSVIAEPCYSPGARRFLRRSLALLSPSTSSRRVERPFGWRRKTSRPTQPVITACFWVALPLPDCRAICSHCRKSAGSEYKCRASRSSRACCW